MPELYENERATVAAVYSATVFHKAMDLLAALRSMYDAGAEHMTPAQVKLMEELTAYCDQDQYFKV